MTANPDSSMEFVPTIPVLPDIKIQNSEAARKLNEFMEELLSICKKLRSLSITTIAIIPNKRGEDLKRFLDEAVDSSMDVSKTDDLYSQAQDLMKNARAELDQLKKYGSNPNFTKAAYVFLGNANLYILKITEAIHLTDEYKKFAESRAEDLSKKILDMFF